MLQALQAQIDEDGSDGGSDTPDGGSDGGSDCGARPVAVAWGFKYRPGYMYSFYRDIDEFYSNLLPVSAKERRGYELILADTACKNYADIEWEGPCDDQHEKLIKLAARLRAFCKAKYDCNPELYVCCSTRPKDVERGLWKNSYHIVFGNLVFDSNHGVAMRAFWEGFKAQLKNPDAEADAEADEWHWVKKNKNGKKKAEHVIDMSVYSRYRPMRLPLCCKSGGAPFVRISGDPYDESDDLTAEFAEDDPAAWKPFAISNPEISSDTIIVPDTDSSRKRKNSSAAGADGRHVRSRPSVSQITRSQITRSQITRSQMLPSACVEALQTLLDEQGSEGCTVTDQMKPWGVVCQNDGTRKCLHGEEVTHNSNNAYLVINREGDVTYKCHASECQGKERHVGMLPELHRQSIEQARQLTEFHSQPGATHLCSVDADNSEYDEEPEHDINLDLPRHNINEVDLLDLLKLLPLQTLLNEPDESDMGDGNGLLRDIAAILKRFRYRAVWDGWAPTVLDSQERSNAVWKAIDASYCQHDLNDILRIVNEDRQNNKLPPMPKIEIIHFERPCLSEANQRRVTAEIDDAYLKAEIFIPSIVAVESCTGTGKTTAVVKHAKWAGTPILSVCALRSQVATHVKDFKAKGLSTVQYDDSDAFKNLNVGVDSLVITIDSLPKLREKFSQQDLATLGNYILLLDEFHSLNSHIFFSTTLRHNRRSVMKTMRWLLKHAGKVVVMDNRITDLDLAVLDSASGKNSETCGDLVFIKNTRKKYSGIQVFYEERDEMLQKIRADMENDRGFTVPCNTKKQADRIMMKLQEKAKEIGIDPGRFKLYTSEHGEVPKDINAEWSGNFVVYSPTITTGIDFQPAQPQNVYAFIEGEDTTSPASVLQMITRNRRIKEVYVSAIRMKNTPEFTSFEQMCQRLDALSASKALLAPEAVSQVATLQELQDRAFNEETDEDDYSDTEFSRLYKQALWHDNIMRSSFLHQLDGLLKSRGFEVNRRSISQMANRDVEKAHRLIGNAEADRRCNQQAKAKVEAYFTGVLSDSIADVQCKKRLDEKVGSLLGIKSTQVAREAEMVEQHRERIHRFVSENPNEREICLEIFVEPKAVDQLRNIKLTAYTEEKLESIDEYYSTKDFAVCNFTRLPANNKVQLLRRLLDIFNRDLPPTCTPLKAYDLTLKQALYHENEEVSVSDEIWQHYTQGRKTCKGKPANRKGLMECIVTLSKELFGKRFVEKTETRKEGAKKVYNYKTNKALLNMAVKLMSWTDRLDGIDAEFARLYGPFQTLWPLSVNQARCHTCLD